MSIEHIGLCVDEPFDMADWYVKNLNFTILKKDGSKNDGVVFIEDSKGKTILELYNAPGIERINFSSLTPLQFHIAIEVENPYEKSLDLEKVGAKIEGESIRNNYKGEKYMVRDPWGVTLQILNRKPKLK
jgi:catechol-2,3-dioxygenase